MLWIASTEAGKQLSFQPLLSVYGLHNLSVDNRTCVCTVVTLQDITCQVVTSSFQWGVLLCTVFVTPLYDHIFLWCSPAPCLSVLPPWTTPPFHLHLTTTPVWLCFDLCFSVELLTCWFWLCECPRPSLCINVFVIKLLFTHSWGPRLCYGVWAG